ncbi:MAG: hypothetical protein VB118_12705 [Oscillospiraceae bacterium]|nr:hypothetical protein [Oscillospiraceae bacterium]
MEKTVNFHANGEKSRFKVNNYLWGYLIFCISVCAAWAIASYILFSKGKIGYAMILLALFVIGLIYTILLARRTIDFQRLIVLKSSRLAAFRLSGKNASFSGKIAIKKQGNDDIRTISLFCVFCIIIGSGFWILGSSPITFWIMFTYAVIAMASCIIIRTIRTGRKKENSGVFLFGDYGIYANGTYYSLTDIGIGKVNGFFSEKNNLIVISYINKFLSEKKPVYVTALIPEGFEEDAKKICDFYASYES